MQTCPKCHHIRQPDDTSVPEWQCPACGVAYAKAAEAASGRPAVPVQASRHFTEPRVGMSPMAKLLTLLLLLGGMWWLFKSGLGMSAGASETDVRALAATVKADDVLIYSTSECGACKQTKSWLQRYGFEFNECNMSTDERCVREFKALGGNGVPYLIVKGHHMTNGFGSDEFLAALR